MSRISSNIIYTHTHTRACKAHRKTDANTRRTQTKASSLIAHFACTVLTVWIGLVGAFCRVRICVLHYVSKTSCILNECDNTNRKSTHDKKVHRNFMIQFHLIASQFAFANVCEITLYTTDCMHDLWSSPRIQCFKQYDRNSNIADSIYTHHIAMAWLFS